ncbi:acyltransferase family protein [Arthrobacter rhombi]|uniref:acyltransferase family protein n=1 Tax=Arthrobacter rhombi TaxID=71253 RepID=UPI003FCF8A13
MPTIITKQNKRQAGRGFRRDIQGLRAVAVALVVVYHILPRSILGGYVGVDVFFVISGFLITSHLLSKPPQNFRMLVDFWARRVRRLIPAALTVILATLCMSWILAPDSRWRSISWDAIASAFYFQNWRLAANSVDYLGAEEAASPLQHYWSLSVEEQFYIFWPILILVVFAITVRRRRKLLPTIIGALVFVSAASFAYGLHQTAVEPAAAYFVTGTRIWELGLGAVVACVYSYWRPGRLLGVLTAWAGLALIMWSAITYTASVPFPGVAALAPTLGAALVIWAGSEVRASPAGPLGLRPVQWIGDASYSIYLWHWPLVVLVPLAGNGKMGPIDVTLIVIATLVLSWASKNLIEDKFRSLPALRVPGKSFAMGGISMMLIAMVAVVPIIRLNVVEAHAEEAMKQVTSSHDPCVGARALDRAPADCPEVAINELVPKPAIAGDDKSDAYVGDCREDGKFTGMKTCTYGDGSRHIALVGNSHAAAWLPAAQTYAKENDLTVTTFLASSCTPIAAPLDFEDAESEGCQAWGQRVLKATMGHQFDAVIFTARSVKGVKGADKADFFDELASGYRKMLNHWVDSGANLLVLHDTPFPTKTVKSIPDCLSADGGTIDSCSADRSKWIPEDPLFDEAKKLGSTVTTADLNDHICRPERCYAANGGIVTYFDGSHMTATYSQTMSPYFGAAVEKTLSKSSK